MVTKRQSILVSWCDITHLSALSNDIWGSSSGDRKLPAQPRCLEDATDRGAFGFRIALWEFG